MISIELIRNDPDRVRDAMVRRGEDVPIDAILELDVKRRNNIVQADELRARRNEVSSQLGRVKERPPELIEEMRGVGAQIKVLEDMIKSVEDEINALVMTMPNLPQDDVPVGEDESDNVEVSRSGEIPTFDFEPKPHWELGEDLGIIDFERGAKMSGSRFFVLKGKGARLQRALIDWMLDLHTEQHGYQEVYLPNMVTAASAIANSNLPKFADTMYHDDEDDLWLLPTAEMALTNLHRDDRAFDQQTQLLGEFIRINNTQMLGELAEILHHQALVLAGDAPRGIRRVAELRRTTCRSARMSPITWR